MSEYADAMTRKAIALNVEQIDEGTLRQAGLRSGQPVIVEAVDGGLIVRAAVDDVAEHAADFIARHQATFDRLAG